MGKYAIKPERYVMMIYTLGSNIPVSIGLFVVENSRADIFGHNLIRRRCQWFMCI